MMEALFLDLGSTVGRAEMKQEVEKHYRRLYADIPVDRFLCCPRMAIGFAAIVRDRLGIQTTEGETEWPDHLILEILINLRKQGVIKAGGNDHAD
jgi:hypothetical protein